MEAMVKVFQLPNGKWIGSVLDTDGVMTETTEYKTKSRAYSAMLKVLGRKLGIDDKAPAPEPQPEVE